MTLYIYIERERECPGYGLRILGSMDLCPKTNKASHRDAADLDD